MTNVDPTTENEKLSGSVLAIIDVYRMGPGLDARDLYPRKAPEHQPTERALVRSSGYTGEAV